MICLLVFIVINPISSQTQQTVTFKEIGNVTLDMELYYPSDICPTDKLPIMIFFFGGGWKTGNKSQFEFYALNFARKGIITVLTDYRIASKHGTTPVESLKDAKSAIRYLKQHAEELQIDTTKIIAAGGSAGGQLAAACQTNETVNEDTDLMAFSSKPNALVLFNPAVDNSSYGYKLMGERWKEISPLQNVRAFFPPTLFLLGTADKLIPVSIGTAFKQEIETVGGRCDLVLYPDQGHGFFNTQRNREQVFKDIETFLISLEYIKKCNK